MRTGDVVLHRAYARAELERRRKTEPRSKFTGRLSIDAETGEFELSIRGNRAEMSEFAWEEIGRLWERLKEKGGAA